MLKSAKYILVALPIFAVAAPASANLPFTCQVNGNTWYVLNPNPDTFNCSFTCVLTRAGGGTDTVSCSASLKPGLSSNTICEGFQYGANWNAANLTAAQCSR